MYVFDTSTFITLFRDGNYDKNIFTTLWENFDGLVEAGRIISVREARREINRVDDALADWATTNSKLFLEPTEHQTRFIEKLFDDKHLRGLVKHKTIVSGGPVADPFIIALAKNIGGCVVTQEKKKPNAPSIPNACEQFSIDCTNLIGFMEREGWKF